MNNDREIEIKMAIIENDLQYIKQSVDEQKASHKELLSYLKHEFRDKVDKCEFEDFRRYVWKMITIMGTAISIFVALLQIIL